MGGARQRRMELGRRAALFHPVGNEPARRERPSWRTRPAACQRRGRLAPERRRFHRRGRAGRHCPQRGSERAAVRRRRLSAIHDPQRAPPFVLRRVHRTGASSPQPDRAHRRACDARRSRSRPSYRHRGAGSRRAATHRCRARSDPVGRRTGFAAIADAIGHRRRRGPASPRHRGDGRLARCRPQPAGSLVRLVGMARHAGQLLQPPAARATQVSGRRALSADSPRVSRARRGARDGLCTQRAGATGSRPATDGEPDDVQILGIRRAGRRRFPGHRCGGRAVDARVARPYGAEVAGPSGSAGVSSELPERPGRHPALDRGFAADAAHREHCPARVADRRGTRAGRGRHDGRTVARPSQDLRQQRLAPGRHLPDGCRCAGRRRSAAARARRRAVARRRCVDHAEDRRRQYQRGLHHDRRKGRGPDPRTRHRPARYPRDYRCLPKNGASVDTASRICSGVSYSDMCVPPRIT